MEEEEKWGREEQTAGADRHRRDQLLRTAQLPHSLSLVEAEELHICRQGEAAE
jgi:hypothetical protein